MGSVKIKIVLILAALFILPPISAYSQHTSRDNYTGMWSSPGSWEPQWDLPRKDSINFDITIYGFITLEGKLSFANFNTNLTVYDTLVIKGDLFLGNRNMVNIKDGGILIIKGNLIINNKTSITADGYLVVTGSIVKVGSFNQGGLTSNDEPAKVFIGGSVPPVLSNVTAYPVLDSVPPLPKTIYPGSHAGYGNMTDLLNDPVSAFLNSLCQAKQISSNSPVCAGQTLKIEASGGTAYQWTGTGGFTSTQQNPSFLNAASSLSGTYSVTITGEMGCATEIKSVSVVVNEIPVASAGINNPVCAGDTVKLSSAGGSGYSWTGPGGFAGSGQYINRSAADESMSGSYTVVVTDAHGCSSSASVILSVSPLPAPVITDNSPVCAGGTLNFSASGGVGFTWLGPEGFNITGASVSRVNSDPGMSGSYSVIVTDAYGCKSDKSFNVIVNSLPAVNINSNGPVCEGSSITLSAQGGTKYLWSGPQGFSGSGENILIPNAAASMSGVYSLTITDLNGCEGTGQINFTVNPLPAVSIAGMRDVICAGDQLILTGNPSGGAFNIISGPGMLSGNTLTGKSPGIIEIEYVYTAACTGKIKSSVSVLDRPVAYAGPDQNLKFLFETKMDASLGSMESGLWTLKSGAGNIEDMNSPASAVTLLLVGENVFEWKVTNAACSDSSLVRINVADMFVPSVITPDGDGKNDYFIIGAPEGHTRLMIFDKWGNQEYRNDNYLNDWCGRNGKGEEMPEDTYFYILEYNSTIIRKGTILILR